LTLPQYTKHIIMLTCISSQSTPLPNGGKEKNKLLIEEQDGHYFYSIPVHHSMNASKIRIFLKPSCWIGMLYYIIKN